MLDDVNLGKLPQLYDYLKCKGYRLSFNEFLEELFSLVSKHKNLLELQDDHLTLNIPNLNTNIQDLTSLLKTQQELETALNIYQNEELVLAKQHLANLSNWSKVNKLKLPTPFLVDSFSTLNQNLNSLSHFFTLYD